MYVSDPALREHLRTFFSYDPAQVPDMVPFLGIEFAQRMELSSDPGGTDVGS